MSATTFATTGAAQASALYVGSTRHRRFTPREHGFEHPVMMAYLDLAELDAVFAAHPAWSTRGFAPAWFRRADHFGDPRMPLDAAVRALVAERTGTAPPGPVRLLTHLRHFGIGMKPASFYYCHDAPGLRVEVVVVEVHNTPWREKHCYVLDARGREGGSPLEFEAAKAFHVSPFMGMDVRYRFRFGVPGEVLTVSIENQQEGRTTFEAKLALARRTITRASLAEALREHPLMTLRVLGAIYGHAFKLWRKGVPYRAHPGRPAGRVA